MDKIGSMMDLLDRFRTEEDCVERLYEMKVEDGWTCPRCGCHSCSLLAKRRKVQSTRCSHQESVTRGTAMYQTHVPLRKWFVAVWLVATDKRGVSALHLSRELHVKWESAYYMLGRIRASMAREDVFTAAAGELERDDAYIGQGGRGLAGRGTAEAPFIAAVERQRKGACAMRATRDCSGASYRRFGEDHVDRSAHIRSDGWSGTLGGLKTWRGLDQRAFDAADDDARLPVVHHVISNFKAQVIGTYHGVTPERLQGYMDEFCWRYNHRGAKGKFDLLLDDVCACSKRPKAMLLEIFATQSPWPEPKVA